MYHFLVIDNLQYAEIKFNSYSCYRNRTAFWPVISDGEKCRRTSFIFDRILSLADKTVRSLLIARRFDMVITFSESSILP